MAATLAVALPLALAAIGCSEGSADPAADAVAGPDAPGDSGPDAAGDAGADAAPDAAPDDAAATPDGSPGDAGDDPDPGASDDGPGTPDEGDPADGGPDGAGDPGGAPRCSLPAVVDTELVVDSGCDPLASDGVRIVAGGRLVLSAGVTVRFSRGAVLQVEGDGELRAAGTAAAPVTLEGAGAERGSWQGILARFAGTDTSTVRLDHAVVRHGGFEGPQALGCLTSDGTPTRANTIEVRDTTFSDCAFYGVLVLSPNQDFAAFERVTVTRADTALSLHADVIGSLPAGVALDAGAVLQNRGGTVQHSQAWQPQGVPWRVDVAVAVGGDDEPVLTLAPGLVLDFVAGGDLIVGATPGGLVADGVTFRPQGGGGPWGGIRFLDRTTVGTLDGVTVQGTGGPDSPGGLRAAGVLIRNTADRVAIRDSVFSGNAVDISVDCASTPALSGNTATVAVEPGC